MNVSCQLSIQYDGQLFAGYELQPGERTVRGVLEEALKKVYKRNVSIITPSRTDAGVHAVANTISFKAPFTIPDDKLVLALNAHLPADLRVMSRENAPGKPVKAKTYEYYIYNGPICPPLIRRFVWHIKPQLSLSKMRLAARQLVGQHDFSSFCASGSGDDNPVKTIYRIEIMKSKIVLGSASWPIISLRIRGSGFLYKMVRNMVGTLVDHSLKGPNDQSIKSILAAKDRKLAGRTAPACGLFLVSSR
ncbi:tRNA pseudouridine(38-40) synthase TruA [candidate division WOR-1 bacterium RIFOXYB2_FULL_48_7]|uniref:tRNA pseudouridine synthase A n=1 Tax=candidate division WOR-1 bacterium RIFOXYB2_FULL_48_7 TaxID=1802583 RepID=A0A1F4TSJ9_UNCSA|nr:MAG: tRNA pseudouridine(38-40) synthase TruA [candidate division WOR-1 bacterium RIFOXYB2_FULL_48_7]